MLPQQNKYDNNDLLLCSIGKLFGPNGPRLPNREMLMISKIDEIYDDGGAYSKGYIKASLEITKDLWFFHCHFHEDPVMPGCLGVDALWQLVGFFLGWYGLPGKGRALGVRQLKFFGEILPDTKVVDYIIDIKYIRKRPIPLAVADGKVLCDGRQVYSAQELKVGLFANNFSLKEK